MSAEEDILSIKNDLKNFKFHGYLSSSLYISEETSNDIVTKRRC